MGFGIQVEKHTGSDEGNEGDATQADVHATLHTLLARRLLFGIIFIILFFVFFLFALLGLGFGLLALRIVFRLLLFLGHESAHVLC